MGGDPIRELEGDPDPDQASAAVTVVPATRRGRRTRAALVHAAARVFARDGFLDARIVDIATEAGVAIGSFYTYFPSKEVLFREVVDELLDELYRESHVGDLAGPDPNAKIAAANRLYLETFARHAALYAVVFQVSTFNEELRRHRQRCRLAFVDRAARGLRHLQETGRADATLDPELFAALLCGMVENFSEVRHLLGQPFDDDAATAALTEIWARAIGLDPPPEVRRQRAGSPARTTNATRPTGPTSRAPQSDPATNVRRS